MQGMRGPVHDYRSDAYAKGSCAPAQINDAVPTTFSATHIIVNIYIQIFNLISDVNINFLFFTEAYMCAGTNISSKAYMW